MFAYFTYSFLWSAGCCALMYWNAPIPLASIFAFSEQNSCSFSTFLCFSALLSSRRFRAGLTFPAGVPTPLVPCCETLDMVFGFIFHKTRKEFSRELPELQKRFKSE